MIYRLLVWLWRIISLPYRVARRVIKPGISKDEARKLLDILEEKDDE